MATGRKSTSCRFCRRAGLARPLRARQAAVAFALSCRCGRRPLRRITTVAGRGRRGLLSLPYGQLLTREGYCGEGAPPARLFQYVVDSPGCWMLTNSVRWSGVAVMPVISQPRGPVMKRLHLAGARIGGQDRVVADAVVAAARQVLRRVRDVGLDPDDPGRIHPDAVGRAEERLVGRNPRVVGRIAGQQEQVPAEGRVVVLHFVEANDVAVRVRDRGCR